VAVDAGIDPTTTTLACSSTVAVGIADACTVTVADPASPAPPTGTVSFSSGGSAFFSAPSCVLASAANGTRQCTVGAISQSQGDVTITASYGGDAVHQASAGTATFCAGTTTQCGGAAPPPTCVVPSLTGKSLSRAKMLLTAAHCSLGKVTRPRHSRHHRLVVSGQSPAAGKHLRNGATVAVRLSRATKRP
jgi:hypothetical protein